MKLKFVMLLSLVCGYHSVTAQDSNTPVAKDAVSVPAQSKQFSGEALSLKGHLEELFVVSKKINDPKEKGQARRRIEAALDWDRVARDCLGVTHWAKQSAKGREEFKNLLREVIVKTAYTRLDKFWDGGTTYHFDKIDIKGQTADVITRFFVQKDSFILEYFLTRKANKWLIDDVAFEDLRYSVNINEQIDAFLKEKSFANLLEKLRKRRDELDSNARSPKKS
ncbi:MAG: ABC transporter substrate-binding protein [Deltaproteobacteria bacterium]|nr:ABC transporter substrate-binding protein [Deltaproteobacteria bacterium]